MLKLIRNQPYTELPLKQWQFPAGETGIKVLSTNLNFQGQEFTILLDWNGNNDLLALGQLVDAVRHAGASHIDLVIPYFPYSRQDRRCMAGEGHALKVVASYINSLGFHRVQTWDAHSYVLEAVVDRLEVIEQHTCASNLPKYDVLIAPDAGASKKIGLHRQVVDKKTDVLIADKMRGEGGAIVGMTIPHVDNLMDQRVCVVDDLCDGGATFIAVARAIPITHRPEVLDLYVTHGLFTKGLDELKLYYDNIYTANLRNPALKGQIKEI